MYNDKQIPQELIIEAKRLLGERAIDIMMSDLEEFNPRYNKSLCPFHKEKTPSFTWYKKGDLFKCFGCDATMDIITYYQEFKGMTFIEAVEELFREVNIQYDFNLSREERQNKKIIIQERKATQDDLTNDFKLHTENLKDNIHIYNYIISSWGLKEETIQKYKLGYSSNGYFNNRIVIPYLNRLGDVTYATGRDATGNSNIKYLKLKSSKTIDGKEINIFENSPLFNEHILHDCKDHVIVVEGEKDCLTLLQEGFKAISFGGSNIKQLKQIERFKNIKTIYVIPDTEITEVGNNKAKEIGELLGLAKSVKIVKLPLLEDQDKTDINDFYNNNREDFKESIKSILEQAEEYKHKGKPFKMTDTGNAERLVYHYGHILKYKVESQTWLKWNGKIWIETEGIEVERLTKEVARNIYNEMQYQSNDKDLRNQYLKFQTKSESKRSRSDMLELAKSEKNISIQSDELDKDLNLLNCKNGTIDLTNGKIRSHNKNNYITKHINIDYNPESKSFRWESFLKEIMNDDKEMIEFLQRAIGYSLTGDTREQVLFIPYGIGSNGKSLFLDTIQSILGKDYSTTIQAESLAAIRDGKEASPDIMQLEGRRFITSSETQKGKGLNESLIKKITGDKTITGRKLYSDIVEFSPQFKVWLATNHKPKITGTDDGIWRRILLIPFTQKFYEEYEGKKPIKDKALQEILYTESEGILNWCIQGAINWYKDGLKVPLRVIRATEEYRIGEDILQDYINNNCIVNGQAKVLFKDLFNSFNNHCISSNEKLITKKEFRNELEEKSFRVENGTGNALTVYGLGLEEINVTEKRTFTI